MGVAGVRVVAGGKGASEEVAPHLEELYFFPTMRGPIMGPLQTFLFLLINLLLPFLLSVHITQAIMVPPV